MAMAEKKIQIKTRNGMVLFEYKSENNTVKKTLEMAVSEGVNLSGADLCNADLHNANLSGANLSNVNLYNADMSMVDLLNANLSDANLYNADLYRANLSGANLSGVEMSEANLYRANLYNADLHNANLSNVNLYNADMSMVDLLNANLSDANLYNADLHNANLSNVNLYNADMSMVDLLNADLSNTNLRNANLYYANLYNANLSNVNLSGANLFITDMSGAKNCPKHFRADIELLKIQTGKLRAYKWLDENMCSPYKFSEYEIGKTYSVENGDSNEKNSCGAGLNVATLGWCLRATNCDLSKIYVMVEFDANDIIAIPYFTDGKFRVRKMKVLKKVPIRELMAAIEPINKLEDSE